MVNTYLIVTYKTLIVPYTRVPYIKCTLYITYYIHAYPPNNVPYILVSYIPVLCINIPDTILSNICVPYIRVLFTCVLYTLVPYTLVLYT